jgi:hypothetical protein
MNRSIFLVIIITFVSGFASADIPDENPGGVVEVYSQISYDKPYRERRPTWTWDLALQYEAISPDDFRSDLSPSTTYDAAYGEPLTNIQAMFGPKYNTRLGSFTLDVLFSRGDVKSSKLVPTSLSITKTGGAITYTADTLFPTPYVAPYIQYQIFGMTYDQSATGLGDFTGEIAMTTAVAAGLLFQLNWLDEDSARAGYLETGIQNSYIDIFATNYASTKSEDAPEFGGTTVGVGFRVEF